jgi:hypothetical protein
MPGPSRQRVNGRPMFLPPLAPGSLAAVPGCGHLRWAGPRGPSRAQRSSHVQKGLLAPIGGHDGGGRGCSRSLSQPFLSSGERYRIIRVLIGGQHASGREQCCMLASQLERECGSASAFLPRS